MPHLRHFNSCYNNTQHTSSLSQRTYTPTRSFPLFLSLFLSFDTHTHTHFLSHTYSLYIYSLNGKFHGAATHTLSLTHTHVLSLSHTHTLSLSPSLYTYSPNGSFSSSTRTRTHTHTLSHTHTYSLSHTLSHTLFLYTYSLNGKFHGAAVLAHMQHLRHLNLSYNNIRNPGAALLAASLSSLSPSPHSSCKALLQLHRAS